MSSRSDGLPRPALADLTNHTRKRALEGYVGKINDCRENGDNLQGSKQNDGLRRDLGIQEAAVGQSDMKAGIAAGSDGGNHVIELDGLPGNFCCSIPLIHVGSDSCDGERSSEEILLGCVRSASKSVSPVETSLTGDKDVAVAYFDLHKSESSESKKIVKPSGVRSFGLERCTSLKGDSNSNLDSASTEDMLKTCSCSFCLKAAYIWSDLNYLDVKGRISVVKKSKKEAINLFQRICIDRESNFLSQGNFDRSSKLESDLSSQWRSLFLHMEEAFSRESNHLQDNFLALKDLKGNCKVNLEMINSKPADHD